MAAGFAREEIDQGADERAARRGDRDAPVPGQTARDFEGIAGLRGDALLEDGHDAVHPLEGEALDRADQQSEEHGAERAGEPDEDGAAHHVEVSTAFEQAVGMRLAELCNEVQSRSGMGRREISIGRPIGSGRQVSPIRIDAPGLRRPVRRRGVGSRGSFARCAPRLVVG